MAAVAFGVDPRPNETIAQDGGHGIGAQAVGLHISVAVNGTEDRTFMRAANEVKLSDTFTFAKEAIPDAVISQLMAQDKCDDRL
ncbi:hypothetical protein [uncultured Celeribacter sp.]|uniref:hypothetical protein n=1 Tax=uncultured Celeribacter sp. TaxID=1303376 RepID=UPI002AA8F256|nr:hypothetical protein [uncultured Celeribacter sp.]